MHYVCKGSCGSSSDEIAICETDACPEQWQMMQECGCSNGEHGMNADETFHANDSNGTALKDGDSVTLIKDLTLRGSSTVLKRGTKVSSIKLTEDPAEVDCKIGGTAIVLRTEFLKKL